ncbi:recombinase RecT [Salibacterium aidingense]|uniref:recombinase RecT n=1 Tax=Salibacterium aidingense TaxID=384933 RepID=UPI0004799526|nr:recombinase RecT [Salibacterium aidingense]
MSQQKNEMAVRTNSERFMNNIQAQFAAEAGSPVAFSEYEKQLAQHLFLKLDSVLQEFEAKRVKDGKTNQTPYTWHNLNMRKLSLDAVHTVQLGLDALIANHVHPVPYFNSKEKKYDLDLRVGYVGKAYYRMEAAVEKPKDIITELVYSNDHFKPIKKSAGNEIENYEFEIQNPFDRGNVIGGFGYLSYEDPTKNKIILVTEEDFQKSRKAAAGKTFWDNHPIEMRYKTLVHRTTEKLKIDPKKVNASYLYMENKDEEEAMRREVNENENTQYLDVEVTPVEDPSELETDSKEEQPKQEKPQPKQEEEQLDLTDSFDQADQAAVGDEVPF